MLLVPDALYESLPGKKPLDAERLRLAYKLFGDRGQIQKLAGGRAHHLYPNDMHPDDRLACSIITAVADNFPRHRFVDDMPKDYSAEGSFVCTGSPVSNERTRAFMEYEYVDSRTPAKGLRRVENPALNLPIEFILDAGILQDISAGNHSSQPDKTVPNWSVQVREAILRPNEETDYLVERSLI